MPMTPTILTVTNRWSLEPYHLPGEWRASIERYGITPVILGMGEEWKGLMTKPRKLRQWLRDGKCESECLIVTDAWDLVFAQDPRAIAEQWEAEGRPYVMNAERNCFPRSDWTERFAKGSSTFRFPNSGFIIASPEDHLKVLESMDLDSIPDDGEDPSNPSPNDQEFYSKAFLEQPVRMVLDDFCRYCQTLCGVGEKEIEFNLEGIFNLETKSHPMAFHFNGPKSLVLIDKVLRYLKLR